MRTLLHWTGERPGDGAGNARPAGVADRYSLLAGDAFEVEYGTDFDLVLLTNSLHVLDAAAIERLLTRVYVALKAGGRVLIVEFIPNQAPWLETHQPKRRVARSARRLLRAIPKSRTGTAPDLAGTLVGKVDRARLITPTRARPGDRLLLTKGAPIEATAIFAREFAERLASVLGAAQLRKAQAFLQKPGNSILCDAQIAVHAGKVTAMHDPTEGGLVMALWETATNSRLSR
jgi:hypothetical protein